MRIFKNVDYHFIEKRRTAYVVSSAVILAGIAAMIVNIATVGSWQYYGVDFLGGSLVQVRFEQPLTVGELRDALGGASSPPITQFGGDEDNEFVIRAPLDDDASITQVADDLEAQIVSGLPGRAFEVERTEAVGAKVGAELQRKALYAVLFSFGLTLLYLAAKQGAVP